VLPLKASAIAPEQSEAQPPPTFANWAAWNGYMSSVPAPHAGCFEAKYPSTVWQASKCGTAPLQPLQPSRASPSTVGNGNDEVAQAPSGKLIGSSVGSFQSVTGLTSETDSKYGANEFGLQVNSQTFTTSTTYTSGKSATGWEQFVFINDPSGEYGTQIYIQYWLLGYHSAYGSCSSTGPPNGSSWMQSGSSCYANSPSTSVPTQTASNLANLILNGYANFGGSNDEAELCISGGSCYSIAITDQVVNLYLNWQDAEFNVFGYGDGSQAIFNSGTSITVVNSLNDQNGNLIVPTCVVTGFTGETNNLNLGSCASNSGQIMFTENSAASNTQNLVTQVDAGSGSVSPDCVSSCSETVGSPVTVTANPSSGWQFSTWSTQDGISCSSNPCAFTMPNNAVTLGATFSQVTQDMQALTTSIVGSGSVGPNCPTGCQEQVGSSVTVTATPAANWQFSSWSVTGASCTGGSSSNPCAFTMPSNAVTVSATFTSTTYSVTFDESGIPEPGIAWGVTVNGNHQSTSSGTSITFSSLTGTVPYSYDSPVPGTGGSYACSGAGYSSCSGSVSSAGTVTAVYTFNPTQTLTTGVDSGSGTVSPNCPSGCGEPVGQSVTVTANPSSGWQFSSWSTQIGVSCSSNPCTFTMPNSQVTLKTTFTQIVQTLTTNIGSGSGLVSPNCPNGCSEGVGSPISVTATASTNWQFSTWSASGASCSGGSSINPCTFTMPNNGVTVSATFVRQQVTMTVSYAIAAGGTPSAPKFNYVAEGVSKSLTLKTTIVGVTVDAGSNWSVTSNPLGGSSSSQRWDSNQPLTGTSSATTVVFVFYRQTWQKLSYSVSGGGSAYSLPTFQANQFGSPTPIALMTTPTGYWYDYGSSWTLTPNPLSGSGPIERWFTTQTTSGTIGGSSTRAFSYQHQFYLTMQVTPSGQGSASPNSGWFNAAQKVTIKATAKTGYKLIEWTGSSYSGTSASATITVNSPIIETANFGVIITITSDPPGAGYVTVDGHAEKTPLTYVWATGSTHTIATNSPVSCGTGCQYVFTGWSDSGAQSHTIIVPNSPTTYKATFQKQYFLTTTVNPSGAGSVSPTNGWYNAGAKIALTATASTGYTFKSWAGTGSGSYTGTNASPTITMNSAITETANFT